MNYYNDAQVTAARAADGTIAQFADIKFAMTGRDGAPRGVSAGFVDFKNRPVTIEVDFAPEAKLATANAGLTDQIEHSGERLLLLFFREKGVRAQNPHVTIAGADVAKLPPGQDYPAPFAGAYSANIFVGGFPFIGLDVSFDSSAETSSRAARFMLAGTPGTYEATPSNIGRIKLLTTADGALASYQQHDRTGDHLIEIRFDPPLPPAERLASETQSAFQISLDNFRDLLAGNIRLHRDGVGVTMDWRFDRPSWAQARVLRTTAILAGDDIAHIDLRPLDNAQ